jgi:hypothetical protein
MRSFFLFLAATCFCFRGFCQYQPTTAAEMTDFIAQVVVASEKNGDAVIHTEAGIFSIRSSHLATFTSRTLFPNHDYAIILFSDRVIPNFKFVLWRLDNGRWTRVDSADQDLAKARNISGKFVGDMEVLKVHPTVAKDYAFQLVSMSGKNETGRYGLVIQMHDAKDGSGAGGTSGTGGTSGNGGTNGGNGGTNGANGSSGTSSASNGAGGTNGSGANGNGFNGGSYNSANDMRDHFYKTRGYKWAYLKVDAQTKKTVLDGNWQTNTEEGLFIANEGKKDFQQLQPTNLASKYSINAVTVPNGIKAFNLTHSSGTVATVEVDLTKNTLTLWSKSNGKDYVIVYTLVENYYH